MSQVHAPERKQFNEAAFQKIDEASSPGTKDSSQSGLALHQVFNQDILNDLIAQSVEVETFTPSVWQKIIAWFKGTDTKELNPKKIDNKPAIMDTKEASSDPIDPVPVLDPPEINLSDILNTKIPPISKKGDLKSKLTSSDIEEALSLMSEQTLETIMYIIFKSQIQIEKENANVAEGTFSKYLDFQKLQQQVLSDIKDALVNDEMIAKRFGTAQNAALLATFMAGVVGLAVTFGIVGPVWGFLSTASAAGLTVSTIGGKAFFQRQMNEHKAQHEDYSHHDAYYNDRVDDSRNRLLTTAEADTIFKERWIQFLRRSDKMRKLVFKK